MSGAAMAMPQDPKAAFKAEWEALEVAKHTWVLKNLEKKLIGDNTASSKGENEPSGTARNGHSS